MNIRCAFLFMALPGALAAQTAVEAATLAAGSATAAAPARKIGQSVNRIFDNVGRSLQGSAKAPQGSKPAARTASAASAAKVSRIPAPPASQAKPAVTYEDAAGIREGMDSGELDRRFGPPALKLTTGPDQETLCYTAAGGAAIDVTLRDGKVATVQNSRRMVE